MKRKPKCSAKQLEYAAQYRATRREQLRKYAAEYYAKNRERINAKAREAARQRDIERLRKTPRCMICDKPLTVVQVRRGVTCGVRCAQLRQVWFVRGTK